MACGAVKDVTDLQKWVVFPPGRSQATLWLCPEHEEVERLEALVRLAPVKVRGRSDRILEGLDE